MSRYLFIFLAIFVFSNLALPQQQQNSNAYAYWDFGGKAIENVDQKVWIAKPANGTQWVMQWFWTADRSHGGYLGFNTSDGGKSQALFSLWNADKAEGENCHEFGGEGVGWSCRKPMELKSDVVYRLRLVRTRKDNDGVWWGAWISQESAAGAKTEFQLGEIRVEKEMDTIVGNSIGNFSEYFGHTVEHCSSVPLSIFVVAPPAANRDPKTDMYALTAKGNGGTDPEMNPCQTGNEPQGNMLKVESFNGTAASVIFAGGTPKDHVMLKGIAIPAAIQASAIVRPSGAESAPSPFTKTRYSVADLTISERSIKNVLILKLEGKLTKAAGTTAVQDAIRDSLGHGKKNILIDLKGITYVEDGVLSKLIDGNPAIAAAGGRVKMLDPSEAFQKTSMIMEFLDTFSTYDNEDEALASFL